jgi:tRNA pseudouridine32 synthase/23S rRNA pseudouridine746 synthase
VVFEPLTGRTPQLRVHSAHPLGLGCGIAGDNLYGDPTTAPRLLLHARTLSFHHPVSGEPLTFVAATPF